MVVVWGAWWKMQCRVNGSRKKVGMGRMDQIQWIES